MIQSHSSTLTKILILIIGLFIGLFFSAQSRVQPARVINPISPFVSLREARSALLKEENALQQEVSQLTGEVNTTQDIIEKSTVLSKDVVNQVEALRKNVGLTDVKGEGVSILLSDSSNQKATANSIAHASDIRDIVELAWSRGATAISVNKERIVNSTSIDSVVNTVMINNLKTVPPFNITIVGPSRSLFEAFNDATLLPHLFQRVRDENLIYQLAVDRNLAIPAYTGRFTVRWARVEP